MKSLCPESEVIAALLDDRLPREEVGMLDAHFADCDNCRREVILLRRVSSEPLEILPQALHEKIVSAPLRHRSVRRPWRHTRRTSSTGWRVGSLAAAGIVVAVLLGGFFLSRMKTPVQEPLKPIVQTPEKKPTLGPDLPIPAWDTRPEKEIVELTIPEWPPQLPEKETAREENRPLVEPVEESPGPEPTREDRVDSPTKQKTIVRRFGTLALLNPTGKLSLRRAGQEKMERIQGIIRVTSGDVIRAESAAAFCLEGGHALALADNTEISLAKSLDEQATWLKVGTGEVLVEPDGNTRSRWTIADNRNAMVVQKVRGRFSAAIREDRISLFALQDRVRVQTETGRNLTVLPGEEISGGTSRVASWGTRVEAALTGHLPVRRSLFFLTGASEELEEGQWALTAGKIRKGKNPFLLSESRKKLHSVVIKMEQSVRWNREYTLRFRYRTNAGRLRVQLPFPRGLGALMTDITVSRDYRNRWISVELPLDRFLVVATETVHLRAHDRMETMEFRIFQKDVPGSARGFACIDDIELLNR